MGQAGQGCTAWAPFSLAALKKLRRSRTRRSDSDAEESLQQVRLYESLRWARLSWETQNQWHMPEVKVLRASAWRETGNNNFEHGHSQVEKAGNNCRLLAKLVALAS